jgi:predicted enzyme related to lactoylglutathione lyase
MAEVTRRAPGQFCWPELATTDQAAAKAFYTSVFGWTTEDRPIGPGATYTIAKLRGLEVGAIYQQEKEKTAPSHWNVYVSVDSADEASARARQLGATVVAEPFDVLDAGRMAVIHDPSGAPLCLWQARRSIGARIVDEPGAMCWCELATTDPARAGRFHSEMFGWKLKPSGGGYTEFQRGGLSIGGMMEITPEWGKVPPHWLTYFAVAECDGTATKAQKLGAQARVPPRHIPNVGRFAVLIDPQGAPFAIIRMDVPA